MLILNYCSLPCPQPVVECKKSLEKYAPKEIQIAVDNKPAVENVTRFLEKNGYQVERKEEKDFWTLKGVLLNGEKGDSVPSSLEDTFSKSPKASSQQSPFLQNTHSENVLHPELNLNAGHNEHDKKTLIFIASDCIGSGDDVLGTKLMESFLSCLKEMDIWQIVLLNGGVRLAATEGKALESLKELAMSGVKIFVCGACLSHYGIYDEKQVGETTNMLDIVTALDLADKVIRP